MANKEEALRMPYLDRDVSWMYFNHRILREAERDIAPLLDRLTFLGIYSNNLDEFFRVRVATLTRVADMKQHSMKEEARHARSVLDAIRALNDTYSIEYSKAVAEVEKKLGESGIRIVGPEQLDGEQMHYVRCIFRRQISGFVSPVWLNKFPELFRESDDHIYLAIEARMADGRQDYAVIDLPTKLCGRFVELPQRDSCRFVMYLDDVVRLCLPMVFAGMSYDHIDAWSFKFTKDAEMDIDNDVSEGILQKISKGVKSRRRGDALRIVYDSAMPVGLLHTVLSKLKLGKHDTVKHAGRYQNHKDFMGFPPGGGSMELRYPAWPPLVPPELKKTDSLLALIRQKDCFIHTPYHTYDYFIRVLQEAAVSKNVKSLKITLYRVARDSKVIKSLICAARNGKKVIAVVELLARFDESSNINWAKKMQDAGINVIFGVEGLKVHSKIVHIGMRNGPDVAIISTGNFHEGNAKTYTDYTIFTARHGIVADVDRVFDFIKRPYNPVEFKHLLVSPNSMRSRFISLIDDEIRNRGKGLEAWIKIKINHITDCGMVEKLYEASRAGVPVELVVRGNCSIITGREGWSENIRGAGIIDRYLEHSRIFIFCAGGEHKTFMGSADWMPRNLDHRVEVVTPVYDATIKGDLYNVVQAGLADNTHARIVDGSDHQLMRTGFNPEPFRSQEYFYNHYRELIQKDKEEK